MADSLDSSDNVPAYTVYRVSRDGEFALAKDDSGHYRVYAVDGEKLSLLSEVDDATDAVVESGWRRIDSGEVKALTAALYVDPDEDDATIGGEDDGLLDAAIADDIVDIDESAPTPFRAPQAVRDVIGAAIGRAQSLDSTAGFSDEDMAIAQRIAFADAISVADVLWINNYFDAIADQLDLHGGFKAQKWAEKILGSDDTDDDEDGGTFDYDPYGKYDFSDSPLNFFACGPEEDSTQCDTLIGIDFDSFAVYTWSHGFEPTPIEFADFEAPSVILVDPETASFLAKSLDSNPNELCDILDANPEERNLFDLAEPDLDYDELDRMFAIIADATGYSSAERSVNAKRQMRNSGGHFDGIQVEQSNKLSKAFKRASLEGDQFIISDAGARIQSFLKDAVPSDFAVEPIVADAGDSQITSMPDPDPTLPAQSDTQKDVTGQPAEPNGSALYFAIVDPSDATAVLELVAITKNSDGTPEAWVRQDGQWKNDPATLANLSGSNPPPVVELDSPEPALSVVKQVDEHASKKTQFPTDAVPGTTASIHDAEDLLQAVESFSALDEADQAGAKHYIKRRARALNRVDILPADWRAFNATDEALASADESVFFGPHGEVLTAAGKGGGAYGRLHGDASRLERYWTVGKGAAKIVWGTPGDLTRAHAHLAKFVGPDRAWGLAQKYHEALFHMSNTKHDKLSGQYVSHRK